MKCCDGDVEGSFRLDFFGLIALRLQWLTIHFFDPYSYSWTYFSISASTCRSWLRWVLLWFAIESSVWLHSSFDPFTSLLFISLLNQLYVATVRGCKRRFGIHKQKLMKMKSVQYDDEGLQTMVRDVQDGADLRRRECCIFENHNTFSRVSSKRKTGLIRRYHEEETEKCKNGRMEHRRRNRRWRKIRRGKDERQSKTEWQSSDRALEEMSRVAYEK